MSLLKFIFYSAVAYFVLKFIVRMVGPKRVAEARRRPARMIKCDACGTFVVEDRALVLGGKGFCSGACVERVARTGV